MMHWAAKFRFDRTWHRHVLAAVLFLLPVADAGVLAAAPPPKSKPLDLEIRLNDIKAPGAQRRSILPPTTSVADNDWPDREGEQPDRLERGEIPNRRRTSDDDGGLTENLLDGITIPLLRVKMNPPL